MGEGEALGVSKIVLDVWVREGRCRVFYADGTVEEHRIRRLQVEQAPTLPRYARLTVETLEGEVLVRLWRMPPDPPPQPDTRW